MTQRIPTQRIPFSSVPKELIAAMMGVEHCIDAAGFDRRLLELLRLRVAQINGCAYCIDMHYKEAVAAGEAPHRLYTLSAWRETDFYDASEQAALAWCEAVTMPHGNCRDADEDRLFAELRRHFDEREVAYLTLVIAQLNAWTRLAKPFGFPAGRYQAGSH